MVDLCMENTFWSLGKVGITKSSDSIESFRVEKARTDGD